MAEPMIETMQIEAAQQAEQAVRFSSMRRMVAIATVGVLSMNACSNENDGPKARASENDSARIELALAAQVEKACGKIELTENRADKHYGTPRSLFPALKHAEADGKESLLPTDKTKELVRQQVCGDINALAVFTGTFLAPREERQFDDQRTIQYIQELRNTYLANPEAAQQAIIKASAAINFLRPQTNFAVISGEAREIQTVRDLDENKADVDELKVVEVQAGTLTGFEVWFNEDDQSLSAEQKAVLRKDASLRLITADGTVVINKLIGDGSIMIEKAEEQTPVEPSPDTTGVTAPGTNESNNSGGGSCGGCGASTGNRTGSGGNCGNCGTGGGGGRTTGTTRGTGGGTGGGGGGTTSTTRPPATTTPTTRPPATTTPTTRPPATTTTTRPQPTTTTTAKGAEPGPDCANNPNDPRC